MAFKDSVTVMYDGSVRIHYLDGPHAYYRQDRINPALPETDDKAWGKKIRLKGTTTLLGDTLEKKGLMTWPLGVALRELFGFYDFTSDDGRKLTGFSKGLGTVWEGDDQVAEFSKEKALPWVLSASKAWQRKQKTGSDVGSLVHDAIEQYTLGTPFELTLERYKAGQEEITPEWLATAEEELKMAQLAFDSFKLWWITTGPTLINAEQVVYSKETEIPGAYDALLLIDGKRVLVDWKTSKASVPGGAPQGVYYSYFIQSAAYASALMEMGEAPIDDLMIVSARKDGGFDTVRASEVGLSMDDAIAWWKAVVLCYRLMDSAKKQLVARAKTPITTEAPF